MMTWREIPAVVADYTIGPIIAAALARRAPARRPTTVDDRADDDRRDDRADDDRRDDRADDDRRDDRADDRHTTASS